MGPPKRKGSTRRPVLDIKNGEDSPSRPTWQTKYQQILAGDAVHQNGDSQPGSSEITSSTTTSKVNPLSGLLGNYNSDSDNEEGGENNMNAKVEDFLKEIQSIAPESSNNVVKNSSNFASQNEPLYSSSVTCWQQCYDQNSGYPYYWNTETNEVTWEMPPDLKAAIESVAMKQQLAQKAQTTIKPSKTNEKTNEAKVKITKTKYPWQTESDSEDEKIEMITSFGPQSGEESDDSEQSSAAQKKKPTHSKIKKSTKPVKDTQVIGPQLPPGTSKQFRKSLITSNASEDTEAEALNESTYETSSLLTHCVQDTGPPGEENFSIPKETVSSSQVVSRFEKRDVSANDVPDSSAKEDSDIDRNFEDENLKLEETKKISKPDVSGNSPSIAPINDLLGENENSSLDPVTEENESILSRLKNKAEILQKMGGEMPVEVKAILESIDSNVDSQTVSESVNSNTEESLKNSSSEEQRTRACNNAIFADDVIAQIEKETPPDYSSRLKAAVETKKKIKESSSTEPKSSNFALVANYGDDSESEDLSFSEKRKSTPKSEIKVQKALFPSVCYLEEKPKPLFPCLDPDTDKLTVVIENRVKDPAADSLTADIETNKIYNPDPNLPDSTTTHKAFKRKKRIEFATTIYGPSTSKSCEAKPSSPEPSTAGSSVQYNMDPSSNEHRGFGFSTIGGSVDPTKKKTYKNHGGIQFIKAETINLNPDSDKADQSTKTGSNNIAQGSSSKDAMSNEEIEDAASLIKEKVLFLSEGKEPVSAVQQMAIQLETLVLAWQQGALTVAYLSRWLNETCAELNRHEKSAAPPGWTCSWDRKNKRYFYRNVTTKAVQWDYPNVEEKETTKEDEVEGGGEEMDLCDTPPHMSPSENDRLTVDEPPSTPPPPIISDAGEVITVTSPSPPPPPQISLCNEPEAPSTKSKKKKRKGEEVSSSSEGDVDISAIPTPTVSTSTYFSAVDKQEAAPPLPPMPPPPPPPPEDPPPPLPESPPPLPIDPDQPLPPGVDEPEYSMLRRLSPKHSFKKTQPDSSTYPADVMMTYGYGLPVQSVVSSSSQAMGIPLQPVDYHSYVHEAVSTNQYMVQSMPTSHVIHCPAKKPKLSLNSELDSFYSDIAMLDGGSIENAGNSNPETALPVPVVPEVPIIPVHNPHTISPADAIAAASVSSVSIKPVENVTSNGVVAKKKKKTKLAPGLSMKKKGVSNLVAKWQQVQQEVRRDYNSDEDDDVSSTHK